MTLSIKARATNEVIASGATADGSVEIYEGSWYYKTEDVDMTNLAITQRTFNCPYKGVCYWVDMTTPDGVARNVAWIYNNPPAQFDAIKGKLGFYGSDTSATLAIEEDAVSV
jgi:uncharacterized protein (DUF427 family)